MVVIANTAAGSLTTAENRKRLAAELRNAGLDAAILDVTAKDEIAAAIEAQRQQGCDTLVAAGGDGTVNAVAALAIQTSMKLGIIPAGTLNHFAKDLNIPLDFAEAVRVIKRGITVHVDVGEVNGHHFVNNSSLGLYPEIVRRREQIRRRGFRKWTAFILAVVATLKRLRLIRVRMQVDGRNLKRRTPFVFVGNNLYELEGVGLGSRCCLDAGALCVCVARQKSPAGLFWMALRGFLGGLKDSRDLEVFATREVRIESHRAVMPVAINGELLLLATPLRYIIRPGLLRVIVRASAGDAR